MCTRRIVCARSARIWCAFGGQYAWKSNFLDFHTYWHPKCVCTYPNASIVCLFVPCKTFTEAGIIIILFFLWINCQESIDYISIYLYRCPSNVNVWNSTPYVRAVCETAHASLLIGQQGWCNWETLVSERFSSRSLRISLWFVPVNIDNM